MFPDRQDSGTRPHHDILTTLLAPNRRRKLLYAIVSLLALVVLLFGRDAYVYTDASNDRILVPPPTQPPKQPPIQDAVAFQPPATPLPAPVHNETVVFSLIMWSEDSAAEGAQLIKVRYDARLFRRPYSI
jgi:hypothetical protein